MSDYPLCMECEYEDTPLEKEPCNECHQAFMEKRTKPGFKLRSETQDVNQERHSICEITSNDEDRPFTGVTISGDEIMRVNKDSAWEVKKIYTDYAWNRNHEELVVVFGRKERGADG